MKVSYIILLIITSVTYGQLICKPCICALDDQEGIKALCARTDLNITLNSVPKYNTSDILSIDMSGQPLQELTELSLTGENLPKLLNAKFQNCSIHSIQKNAFQNMGSLEELDMSYNNLRTLNADIFKEIPNVQYIRLNYNKIKSVTTGLFSSLQQLVELNLENNLITSVEENAFPVTGNLRVVNLNNNSILWIHASAVKQLTSIEEFFLSGIHNENLAPPFKCENDLLQTESENICGIMCRNFSSYEFLCHPEIDNIIKKNIIDNTKLVCTISSYPVTGKRMININEVQCDRRNDFSKTIIFLCNTTNVHCETNKIRSSNIIEKDNDILKRQDILLTLCCTTWGIVFVLMIILGTVIIIIIVVLFVKCRCRRINDDRIPRFPSSIGNLRMQAMNRADRNVLRRQINTEEVSQSSDEEELQEPSTERQELRESQIS